MCKITNLQSMNSDTGTQNNIKNINEYGASYQQILDEISNLKTTGGIYNTSVSRQAIINSNFDIWQNGTSFTNPTTGSYTADMYQAAFENTGTLPTTLIHSRQAVTPGDLDKSFYFYRLNTNGAGSGFGTNDNYRVFQNYIENGTRYLAGASKEITISFYAKSSISDKKLGLGCLQTYGTGGSPSSTEILTGTSFTLTSSWVKYSFTFTVNTLTGKTFGTDNNDYFLLFLGVMWGTAYGASVFGGAASSDFQGSGNIDIAQLQLSSGGEVLDFMPKSFAQELRDCQRYYEKSFGYATTPAQNAGFDHAEGGVAIWNATFISDKVRFKITKRIAPTMTLYNPANTNAHLRNAATSADLSGSVTTQVTPDSFRFYGVGDAGMALGDNIYVAWTADARF